MKRHEFPLSISTDFDSLAKRKHCTISTFQSEWYFPIGKRCSFKLTNRLTKRLSCFLGNWKTDEKKNAEVEEHTN